MKNAGTKVAFFLLGAVAAWGCSHSEPAGAVAAAPGVGVEDLRASVAELRREIESLKAPGPDRDDEVRCRSLVVDDEGRPRITLGMDTLRGVTTPLAMIKLLSEEGTVVLRASTWRASSGSLFIADSPSLNLPGDLRRR